MDVHQAKAFLEVAKELHFGRAAANLRMAQPALSRLVKQLEHTMHAQLLERSTRHVSLTPAGQALLGPAEELVKISQTAQQVVRTAVTGETGEVRIGFAGASTNMTVGALARELRKAHPGLRQEFHSSQFSHVGLERILDNTLDLAIGRWDFIPPEVDSYVMATEQVIAAVPASHPLATHKSISMSQLADEQWIALPGGFSAALQNRLNTLSMSAGFAPRIIQSAPDTLTQLVLVSTEMGCALTVDSVRGNITVPGVSYIPLRDANTQLAVRLIWRRDDSNAALHNVIALAKQVFPGPAAG